MLLFWGIYRHFVPNLHQLLFCHLGRCLLLFETFQPMVKQVLSSTAQMFNMLGSIIIWLAKLQKNDPLNEELLSEWNKYFNSIENLSNLKILRHLFLKKQVRKIYGFYEGN